MTTHFGLLFSVSSHVLAAYASFLWESEEYEDGSDVPKDLEAMPPHFHAAVASASA